MTEGKRIHLEEADPLKARALPPGRQATGVQQCMHVAVPMRLGLERERVRWLECQRGVVVNQARHLLLLDEGDLPEAKGEARGAEGR